MMVMDIKTDKRSALYEFLYLKCKNRYLNAEIWSVLVLEVVTWRSLF